jgi:parvulin-like peptidyl-prolyl isomerase
VLLKYVKILCFLGNIVNRHAKFYIVPFFLFYLAVFPACSKKESAHLTDKGPVLATVNGEEITQDLFNQKAERLQKILSVNLDVYEEKKKLLDNIITATLLYQKAKEEKLDTELEFKEFLSTQYLKRKIPDVEVTDDEAKKYFEVNKAKYEKIRVAHILIKPKEPGKQPSELEASRKAAEILVRLLNGEDFAKLAKEQSDDKANAAAGGNLGFFPRGLMVKEFEDAAFSLKEPGDLSKVVKTAYGYHIIKLLDAQRGFETFKDQVKATVKFEKQRKDYEALIAKIKEGARITVDENRLKEIKVISESAILK